MIRSIQFLFGQFVPRCAHRIDKHFDYCVLQYAEEGSLFLKIDQARYEMSGPFFFSSYPGPRIAFRPLEPKMHWRHRYIAFSGPIVKQWTSLNLFPIAPQSVEPKDFAERFDALLHHALLTDRLSHLRAAHILEGLLIDLADARNKHQQGEGDLKPVLRQLRDSMQYQDIDYAALADESGISERTLRRKVTAATGMSPHEYVVHARIAEARRLLGETDLPAKLIAQKLGYRDVYFFSRQFKQITGVPPITYRKSRQV